MELLEGRDALADVSEEWRRAAWMGEMEDEGEWGNSSKATEGVGAGDGTPPRRGSSAEERMQEDVGEIVYGDIGVVRMEEVRSGVKGDREEEVCSGIKG